MWRRLRARSAHPQVIIGKLLKERSPTSCSYFFLRGIQPSFIAQSPHEMALRRDHGLDHTNMPPLIKRIGKLG